MPGRGASANTTVVIKPCCNRVHSGSTIIGTITNVFHDKRLSQLTRVIDFFRFGGNVFSTVDSVIRLLRLRLMAWVYTRKQNGGETVYKFRGIQVTRILNMFGFTFLLLPELLVLLPVLAPEGEPGLESLVNFRPGSGESRVTAAKRTKILNKKQRKLCMSLQLVVFRRYERIIDL